MNGMNKSLLGADDGLAPNWQRVNRIVFTADILRPFATTAGWESATWKNIRWLEHLIGWQILKATELTSSRVSWEPGNFNTPAIYQQLSLHIGYDAWASIFYAATLPATVEENLVAPFAGACVIGCEIPDVLQWALTRNGIPFIDIVSHPVRFMEDLLFGFRTNDPRVHAKLLAHQINLNDHCVPRANLLRAKSAWMPALNLPAGTALIAGQVATDKALICRQTGNFLNLGNFTDKLFEICEKHPLVLFKPHPYQDANCPSRRAIQAFGVIRNVNHNFYYLMAQEGLTDIYAINSGTVSEAPYFDRRGHFLGEPLYSFDEKPPVDGLTGAAIPIDSTFLQPAFWADILQPLVPVHDQLPVGPGVRPSLLRRSLNADWDYGFIDEVVQRGAMEGVR